MPPQRTATDQAGGCRIEMCPVHAAYHGPGEDTRRQQHHDRCPAPAEHKAGRNGEGGCAHAEQRDGANRPLPGRRDPLGEGHSASQADHAPQERGDRRPRDGSCLT